MSVELANDHTSNQPIESDYTCITGYNEEIKRSTILLNNLSKLLQEEKLTPEAFLRVVGKYRGKLEFNLKLREVYQSKILAESDVIEENLASAVEEKELLLAKKKINDISEEEYSIKFKAIDWDLNSLNNKKKELSEGLNLIQNLKEMINTEDVTEFASLTENECKLLKEVGVDEEVCINLASILGKIIGIKDAPHI